MEKFEVRFKKTDLLIYLLCESVFIIACIVMFIKRYNFKLSMILAIYLFVTSALMVSSTILFRVSVENEKFKVRTKFGKKYEFDLSEIFRINYTKHDNLKHGPQYVLIITTQNRELELIRQMKGFDTMVNYLLNKYNDGKIDDKVISKYCYCSLKKINN